MSSRTLFMQSGAMAAAGVLLACGAVLAADSPAPATMSAGKGLSLDIGGKHTMSYFEPKDGMCSLTIMMAAVEGGMAGTDTPGTRISVLVNPNKSLRIDAAQSQSAEFACGDGGKNMTARVFGREDYAKTSK